MPVVKIARKSVNFSTNLVFFFSLTIGQSEFQFKQKSHCRRHHHHQLEKSVLFGQTREKGRVRCAVITTVAKTKNIKSAIAAGGDVIFWGALLLRILVFLNRKKKIFFLLQQFEEKKK